MHNQVAVRVCCRFAHLKEEVQALLQGSARSLTVLRDWQTLDELHHHVRSAVLGEPPVVQSRNSGMF